MTLFPTLAVQVPRMVIFEVRMGIEQQLKDLEKRRKRGMRLLAQGLWPAEVARKIGVTRQSVLRWTQLKKKGGVEALKRPEHFGRPPKLNDAQRAELIKERFAVELSQPSVWRMLQQLGWSVQRPTGQARQRDEAAISTWKEKRWPAVKKSLRDKAE